MAMSHDELFGIFSWLPAKDIYRFKSASKLFSTFSEETYFALKQAQNALKKDESCFFIQPDIELHPLTGEEVSSGVSNDVIRFLANSEVQILASSNGLILCLATNKIPLELFICNPATKSWMPLTFPQSLQVSLDAYFDVVLEYYDEALESDGYRVYLFDKPIEWSSYYDCKFYLPKEGVWKSTGKSFFTGGRNMRFDMPVHHNGAVHFISDSFPYIIKGSPYFRPYIMSYNFENGMSRMLTVPKEARRGSHDCRCDMGIFKWGKVTSSIQSICLVRLRKSVFTIWILTNYELSTWRKILKIRVKAMGLMEQDPVVKGFTVLSGDLLVFATEEKVYGYGLRGERYMKLEKICEHGCEWDYVSFISYSNTLRPCGNGATTMPCYTTRRPSGVKKVL